MSLIRAKPAILKGVFILLKHCVSIAYIYPYHIISKDNTNLSYLKDKQNIFLNPNRRPTGDGLRLKSVPFQILPTLNDLQI